MDCLYTAFLCLIKLSVLQAGDVTTGSFYRRKQLLENYDFTQSDVIDSVRSEMSCCLLCDKNTQCNDMSYNDDSNTCKLFYSRISASSPYTPRPGWISLSRVRDCLDLFEAGESADGKYLVYPKTSPGGLQVYCDQKTDSGGWLMIQRRENTDLISFNRSFVDYEEGFGDLTTTFWIGNRALHLLTSAQDYKLRVDVWKWSGKHAYAEYHNFHVGNASTRYTLNVTGYHGTAGDCLFYHNGQMFHTYDFDTVSSCALVCGGGWWYNGCWHTNPNGIYSPTEQTTIKMNGVYWLTWTFNSLKEIQMKIKRK